MTRSPQTQVERVVAALRKHPRGITQVDFDLPHVCDGGKPIKRVAARIHDFCEKGGEVARTIEPNGLARYRLIRLPAGWDDLHAYREHRAQITAATAPAPAASRQCAIFDYEDEVA